MLGWCMHCHGTSDVTVSAESNGYIAHYAACLDHVEEVVALMRQQTRKPRRPLAAPAKHTDAVDVGEAKELPAGG